MSKKIEEKKVQVDQDQVMDVDTTPTPKKDDVKPSHDAKKDDAKEKAEIGKDLPTKEQIELLVAGNDLDKIRATVDDIVKAQNEWLLCADATSANKWDDPIDELIGRYTSIQKKRCYDECLAAENPMIHACKKLTFPTIRVRETREGKIIKRVVVDTDRDIDLLSLHKESKDGIGADKHWLYKLQKLNFLLAIRCGQDIGDPRWMPGDGLKRMSDSFVMDQIARDFNMGKNPCSNTQMLKTLTSIVQSMIGEEYKCTSHDVKWLDYTFAKKDKKAKTVVLPTHKSFCLIMRDMCNNVLTQTGYTANSKAVKEKK